MSVSLLHDRVVKDHLRQAKEPREACPRTRGQSSTDAKIKRAKFTDVFAALFSRPSSISG